MSLTIEVSPAVDIVGGKTIKQLAFELGVSKQTVRNHAAKLQPNLVSNLAGQPMRINPNGEAVLLALIKSKTAKVETNLQPNLTDIEPNLSLTEPNLQSNLSLTEPNLVRPLQLQVERLERDKDTQRQDFISQIDELKKQLATKDKQLEDAREDNRKLMILLEHEQELRAIRPLFSKGSRSSSIFSRLFGK
jgi:hypothetical protein